MTEISVELHGASSEKIQSLLEKVWPELTSDAETRKRIEVLGFESKDLDGPLSSVLVIAPNERKQGAGLSDDVTLVLVKVLAPVAAEVARGLWSLLEDFLKQKLGADKVKTK